MSPQHQRLIRGLQEDLVRSWCSREITKRAPSTPLNTKRPILKSFVHVRRNAWTSQWQEFPGPRLVLRSRGRAPRQRVFARKPSVSTIAECYSLVVGKKKSTIANLCLLAFAN